MGVFNENNSENLVVGRILLSYLVSVNFFHKTTTWMIETQEGQRSERRWKKKPLNQKKGFMTPERKKKLRLLLRKKAAEELKKEQELKAKERRRVIDQRYGQSKSTSGLGEGELKSVCQEYYNRICQVESSKYDLEKEVEYKDYMIDELNIAVNDLRGKFIKPSLKKVSKYENKFAKLQK